LTKNELLEIWEQALYILEKKLNKHSYNTWIKPIKPISYYNNRLIIETPNNFSKSWLSERYAPLVKSVFEDILQQTTDVQFVIPGEKIDDYNPPSKATRNDYEESTQTHFNPKYTFDSFVVGNSNRFAHAACLAVAELPAKAYNPLFIYGGVGLGKTHLMHAIGHYILEHSENSKVSYASSEQFTNELINAIRFDRTVEFRNKYRSMDVLLVDDIQFLAGKESTQEEFFHTFNTLYEANKQIIISSDRPPKEIPTLEDRLRSRFEWGLITDIQPPDLETRIAILRKKAQQENLFISDESIFYIADNINSNIRELEGALIRVKAYATLNNKEITTDLVAEILKDVIPTKKPKPITAELIQQVVASHFNIRVEDFKAKKRTKQVAFPRQVAMYLVREMTDLSLPKIGEAFGGRDHTTVIHACEKIATELNENYELQEKIKEIINKIKKN